MHRSSFVEIQQRIPRVSAENEANNQELDVKEVLRDLLSFGEERLRSGSLDESMIILTVIAEFGGVTTTFKKKFSKTTTCAEVITILTKRFPNTEENFGLYVETSSESFWLEETNYLKDYEEYLGSSYTCYLKQRGSESSVDLSELIPERTLIILTTHTRFMTSFELLKVLHER